MEFRYLSHFLYTDFYRGLMAGNIPHRCHNCGQYLLLTAGYNTCYCNNVAPGETERTCRKIGAHRKANHPQGLSPAGVEYRKVYNRLKARTQRRKISRDEWNAVVFQAQAVLELCDTIGSPWWKGITLYVSWKIRRLTAERECRRGELEELWPPRRRSTAAGACPACGGSRPGLRQRSWRARCRARPGPPPPIYPPAEGPPWESMSHGGFSVCTALYFCGLPLFAGGCFFLPGCANPQAELRLFCDVQLNISIVQQIDPTFWNAVVGYDNVHRG